MAQMIERTFKKSQRSKKAMDDDIDHFDPEEHLGEEMSTNISLAQEGKGWSPPGQ
jgi:hypothetical protein